MKARNNGVANFSEKEWVELWQDVQKDVIDFYHQEHGPHGGFDSSSVVEQAFEHWFGGYEPQWDPRTDIRSYLFGIAKRITEGMS
jgi:hypothetical protein